MVFKAFIISLGLLASVQGAIESSTQTTLHRDPQVAMICPEKTGESGVRSYHNQYMTTAGKWATDFDEKATCKTDKVEILEYCKKVYPDLDINNIVEGARFSKIGNWCKFGRRKCKGPARWVKPYRCLAGPFQSDALLVPEHCLFDHIHNQTRCWDFDRWNHTASGACQERGMRVKSFAMLLPCGIDVFSGVEFVCCPEKKSERKAAAEVTTVASEASTQHENKEKLGSSVWPSELKLQEVEKLKDDDVASKVKKSGHKSVWSQVCLNLVKNTTKSGHKGR